LGGPEEKVLSRILLRTTDISSREGDRILPGKGKGNLRRKNLGGERITISGRGGVSPEEGHSALYTSSALGGNSREKEREVLRRKNARRSRGS